MAITVTKNISNADNASAIPHLIDPTTMTMVVTVTASDGTRESRQLTSLLTDMVAGSARATALGLSVFANNGERASFIAFFNQIRAFMRADANLV